jgi:serine/threonine protein phosphatase PrpC
MKPLISTPAAINQVGSRSVNEDTIYPELGEGGNTDDLFMVCDGIGGAEQGEVASKLACQGFVDFFNKQKINESTTVLLNEALVLVEKTFEDYVTINPAAKGMGTTLTLVHFHDQGATLSHCGDSRIYHIRKGEILFQTEDHSLVNEMLKNKILTKEEAANHPKKNVITRAIQAGHKKEILDTHFIKDIRPKDYFFMCTDGILEQVTNEVLENTLDGKITPQDGIKVISNYCDGKTKDNYSAYLIQVAEEDLAFSMEAVGKENFKWVKVALVVVMLIILWLLGSKFFVK